MTEKNFVVRHGLEVYGDANVSGSADVSGNVKVGGNLNVSGSSYLSGGAVIRGNISGNSTLNIKGNTSLGGTLTVSGHTDLNRNLDVSGTTCLGGTLTTKGATSLASSLDVKGNTSLGGTLTVSGHTNLNRNLDVSGNTSLHGTLVTKGSASFASSVNIKGNTSVGGTLNVSGATNITNTLTVSGHTDLNRDLNVSGNTSLNGTLVTKGAASFASNIKVGGNLDVVGNTSLLGDLYVSGSLQVGGTGGGFSIEPDATFLGTLTVSGHTDLNRNLDVSGTTCLGGTLTTKGATSLASSLDVKGNTSVGGTLTVSGHSDLNRNLDVSGSTSIGGDLTVTGNVSVNGGMIVSGSFQVGGAGGSGVNIDANATFGGTLTVSGNTTLNGSVDVSGGIQAGGTLSASTLKGANHCGTNANFAYVSATTLRTTSFRTTGSLTVCGSGDISGNLQVAGVLSGTQLRTTSLRVTGGTAAICGSMDVSGSVQIAGTLSATTTRTTSFKSTGIVQSGAGSGGVALTINDGYGNANVTFNHQSGIPEQNGNAGRIVVPTDATTSASMDFQLKSNVSGSSAVTLTQVLNLDETRVYVPKNLTVSGTATINGSVDVSGSVQAGGTLSASTLKGANHCGTNANFTYISGTTVRTTSLRCTGNAIICGSLTVSQSICSIQLRAGYASAGQLRATSANITTLRGSYISYGQVRGTSASFTTLGITNLGVTGTLTAAYISATSLTTSGTITIQNVADQALFKNAGTNPTIIHRNDGSNYYILLSDSFENVCGTWNTLRPFYINNTTGKLNSLTGQIFTGGTNIGGGLTVSGAASLCGALTIGGKIDAPGQTISAGTIRGGTHVCGSNGNFAYASATQLRSSSFRVGTTAYICGNLQATFASAGQLRCASFRVTGNGTASICGSMDVSGSVQIAGTLSAATLKGTVCGADANFAYASATQLRCTSFKAAGTLHVQGAAYLSGTTRIQDEGHEINANDYHLELYSPHNTVSDREVSIRFHHGNRWFYQIRARAGGFWMTNGSDGSLVDLTVSDLFATYVCAATIRGGTHVCGANGNFAYLSATTIRTTSFRSTGALTVCGSSYISGYIRMIGANTIANGINGMSIYGTTWSGLAITGPDATKTFGLHYGGNADNKVRFGRYAKAASITETGNYEANPFMFDLDDGLFQATTVQANVCGTQANFAYLSATTIRTTSLRITGNGTAAICGGMDVSGSLQVRGVLSGTQLRTTSLRVTGGGTVAICGDGRIRIGPNSTWSQFLHVGGNGNQANASAASVVTTNGNLHLDAADNDHSIYLNWYGGNAGTVFGAGDGTTARGRMDGAGNFGAVASVSSPIMRGAAHSGTNANFAYLSATTIRTTSFRSTGVITVCNGAYLSTAYANWFRAKGGTGFYFQDRGTGIRSPLDEGGEYGSVATYGAENGWDGFSLGGRHVFMGRPNATFDCGIYDDGNNRWILYVGANSVSASLRYQGTERVITTGSGIRVSTVVSASDLRASFICTTNMRCNSFKVYGPANISGALTVNGKLDAPGKTISAGTIRGGTHVCGGNGNFGYASATQLRCTSFKAAGTLHVQGAAYLSGTTRVVDEAHDQGANDYHLELFSNNTGSDQEISLRFHHGQRYYYQIRSANGYGGFRMTAGNDNNLVDLTVSDLFATFVGGDTVRGGAVCGANANFAYVSATTLRTTSLRITGNGTAAICGGMDVSGNLQVRGLLSGTTIRTTSLRITGNGTAAICGGMDVSGNLQVRGLLSGSQTRGVSLGFQKGFISTTFSKEVFICGAATQMLLRPGAGQFPTVIHRNDASNYYILRSSNTANICGSWTTARPWLIRMSDSKVIMQNGADLYGNFYHGNGQAYLSSRVFIIRSPNEHHLEVRHSSSSHTQPLVIFQSRRANAQGYSFLWCRSNNGGDIEFNLRGDGRAFADRTWNANGADYAEYFEWKDGNPDNEDRTGYSVTMVSGDKIGITQSSGQIPIGIVSKTAGIVGNAGWNSWSGKYQKDVWGDYIRNEKGSPILNPDYDENMEYVSREDRPEWDTIGLLGKLRMRRGQITGSNWLKLRDITDNVEEWLVK